MEHSTGSNDQDSFRDAYDLGYEDVDLIHQVVKTNDETPEQDELRQAHNRVASQIREMDAESLRAYVQGMRGYLWDHLW